MEKLFELKNGCEHIEVSYSIESGCYEITIDGISVLITQSFLDEMFYNRKSLYIL